ncbi:hypothetical protein F5X71_24030 [Nocardia brasiliensis]|uniref:Lipoprotein n=1 Tax=Nocardia brasiliensis TaxID=37326 RepID=A0A6G9XVK2_NOCBR|nr:hypothetical protein [Nocardia brasiliensis]QIS04982.1 hypothetical protein F5X71_24030 [Nocardia brasiliensis]
MKAFTMVFALGAGILAGCGDERSDQAYCDALKDLGSGSYVPNTANSETVPKMRKIAELAPPDIESDWHELADSQERLMKSTAPDPAPLQADIGSVAQRIVDYNQKTCMK